MKLRYKLPFFKWLAQLFQKVSGIPPLVLRRARAGGLTKLMAYGGLTQADVPSEYTRLEYLESTGTQYIDTGVVNSSMIGIEATFVFTNLSGSNEQYPFGNAAYVNGPYRFVLGKNNSGIFVGYYLYNQNYSQPYVTDTLYTVQLGLINHQRTAIVNSTTIADLSNYSNWSDSRTILLFCRGRNLENTASEFSKIKLYTVKIYSSNTIVQYLLPAKRNSDNVLGMYDAVSGSFFTNAGTGNFTAGPEVVPTPDNPIPLICNNGELKVDSNGNVYCDGLTETLKISTKNLFNADLLLGSRPTYYKKEPNGEWTARVPDYSAWTTVYNSSYLTLNPGKYTLSSTKSGTLFQYSDSDGTSHISSLEPGVYYSLPKTFTITEPVQFNVKLRSSTTYPNNLGKLQLELNASATPYIDNNSSMATTEMLLKLGDYVDSQDILRGIVNRQLGIHVFDGTETLDNYQLANCYSWQDVSILYGSWEDRKIYSTHYQVWTGTSIPPIAGRQGYVFRSGWSNVACVSFGANSQFPTVSAFQNFLSQQYSNGTPVIVVYPLATPTTESVTPQPMSVVDGDNTLEIVQASLTGLELTAEYKRH